MEADLAKEKHNSEIKIGNTTRTYTSIDLNYKMQASCNSLTIFGRIKFLEAKHRIKIIYLI